jgi:hypothetical protein
LDDTTIDVAFNPSNNHISDIIYAFGEQAEGIRERSGGKRPTYAVVIGNTETPDPWRFASRAVPEITV